MPGYYPETETSWSPQEKRTADYLTWVTAFVFRVPNPLPVEAQVVLRHEGNLIPSGRKARMTPRKVSVDQL